MTVLVADALKWQEGGNSSSTVKSKVWRPSKPVIHAAAAWCSWYYAFQEEMPEADPYLSFFFNLDIAREVVGLSEINRKMVPKITQYKISDDELIKFSF
jgi:hypothetical protein